VVWLGRGTRENVRALGPCPAWLSGPSTSPLDAMDHRQRIAERISRLGDPNDPNTPRPLLTIDEFFDGNDFPGSIGCNLSPAPSPDRFYSLFKTIASRPDVKDIRIRIVDFDDADWPFTDTVFVMTCASVEEVKSWFDADLAPDDVWEGFYPDESCEPYVVPPGTRPVAVWWD